MNHIRKIRKRDIPALLDDSQFWNHDFLAVSRHRLYAHYNNPAASENDVILLLAYTNEELVGYMGAYIDRIVLNNVEQKIAWLSTWWVHPKTKGSGIGREILNTMYTSHDGRIGISQFTPSAKRVYDKSGFFYDLKKSEGIKAVLKSHLQDLVPTRYPQLKWSRRFLRVVDGLINGLYSIKHKVSFREIKSLYSGITLEYLDAPDKEAEALISSAQHHISPKDSSFFRWLATFHWVAEAPIIEMTARNRYEFSMYDKTFSIYLVKVARNGNCIGFLVLQKRNRTIKVLYTYYNRADGKIISDIIKLHCMRLDAREVITYDDNLVSQFRSSGIFIYTRKKIKHSIISKVFGVEDFSTITLNYGDGDCSFA